MVEPNEVGTVSLTMAKGLLSMFSQEHHLLSQVAQGPEQVARLSTLKSWTSHLAEAVARTELTATLPPGWWDKWVPKDSE